MALFIPQYLRGTITITLAADSFSPGTQEMLGELRAQHIAEVLASSLNAGAQVSGATRFANQSSHHSHLFENISVTTARVVRCHFPHNGRTQTLPRSQKHCTALDIGTTSRYCHFRATPCHMSDGTAELLNAHIWKDHQELRLLSWT